MLNNTLSLWIAQSESWQTFIDFNLPEDSISKYPFLNRPDDFYISLFGCLFEVLENPEENKVKMLSLAKGLEIYSLESKRKSFYGVNHANNILFASGLYYLADYSSSASIYAKLFSFEDYELDIEKFLLSFLKREKIENNSYRELLNQFLRVGNTNSYKELIELIQKEKDYNFKYDPYLFSLYYLAEAILLKFQKNNIWSDLLHFKNDIELWKPYIEKSIQKKYPIWDFFPAQKLALEKGILGEFNSIALQTPTSSGKTAICELLIYNELKNNPENKILYLAPFRALASELKGSFGKNLANLGISSKTIYGGDIPTIEEKNAIQNVSLLISTPEKFMAMENIDANFSKGFNIIICDEGHLLDKGQRGLSYELLLSRFKKDKNKKFVFLSAIIPNIEDINIWLGDANSQVVKSDFRATEIEFAFLKESSYSNKKSPAFELEVNPLSDIPKKYILNKFLTEVDLAYVETLKTKTVVKLDSSGKSKSAIIALKAIHSGTVALFSPIKGPTEGKGSNGVMGLALEIKNQIDKKPNLYKKLNLKEKTENKNNLKAYFKIIFGEEYLLTQIIDYGFLLHHGDLPQNIREIIEEFIRNEIVKLIVCTNTLAEGINLPIKTIIIHSTKRDPRQSDEDVNLKDLKNLFGRAGRAGKETKGLIIAPNTNDFEIIKKVIREEGFSKVEGYLYKIIKEIIIYFKKNEHGLTNDILDKLNDYTKGLIDVIDSSIIDLLDESIDQNKLEDEVHNLIEQTFAFHQANSEEKETLNTLIQLRGENIKKFVKDGDFPFIKKSSSNLRNYTELKDKLEIDNPIWTDLDNPINEKWLAFILNMVFDLSTIKYQLREFNEKNFKKRTESYLAVENIKDVIKMWISGEWYEKISTKCSESIDITLRLVNAFIGYNLQSAISSIIHVVELKLREEKNYISKTALDFPQYLLYGLQTRLQLDLIELGFTDRIGIIRLAEIIKDTKYSNLSELKDILNYKKNNIFNKMEANTPQISLQKVMSSFDYLEYALIK